MTKSATAIDPRMLPAELTTAGTNRLAYAFYAADDEYAVAVLVAAKALKKLSSRDDIDFVVLHLDVASHILDAMRSIGMLTTQVASLPYVYSGYYKDCLTKLRIFQLLQYDRIVYLDADTLPLKCLDHLFSIPFSEPIAAPPAYWLSQPYVTSLLLVAKPSLLTWNRAARHFESAREKRWYDMDIVNHEFRDEIYYLPEEYACLNSEWEDVDAPFHFGDPGTSTERIMLVHFTACGKPWHYHPSQIRRLRPNAHQMFYMMWERWWLERDGIIAHCPFPTRLQLAYLKHVSERSVGQGKLPLLESLTMDFDDRSNAGTGRV